MQHDDLASPPSTLPLPDAQSSQQSCSKHACMHPCQAMPWQDPQRWCVCLVLLFVCMWSCSPPPAAGLEGFKGSGLKGFTGAQGLTWKLVPVSPMMTGNLWQVPERVGV